MTSEWGTHSQPRKDSRTLEEHSLLAGLIVGACLTSFRITVQDDLPGAGNGATHGGQGHPTSMKNQDHPPETFSQEI